MYSWLTKKTPEWRQWYCTGVFIINFEKIPHIVLMSSSSTLICTCKSHLWNLSPLGYFNWLLYFNLFVPRLLYSISNVSLYLQIFLLILSELINVFFKGNRSWFICLNSFNPFLENTSVFRGCEMGTLARNGLILEAKFGDDP